MQQRDNKSRDREFEEKIIKIERVAKVVKGGRRFSFNALAVVGDHISRVGIGFGKANEVPDAIRKAVEAAKKNMITVNANRGTVPFEVVGRFKSANVMIKPAAPGTGIIAGDAVRAVVEKAGITNVLTKSTGSGNPLNIVKAAFEGLKQMESAREVAKRRGLSVDQIFHRPPRPAGEAPAAAAVAVEEAPAEAPAQASEGAAEEATE